MLISVRIPKTAGYSLQKSLSEVFGKRLYLEYSMRPLSSSTIDRAARLKRRINVTCLGGNIVRRYDAIYCHIVAHTFNSLPCPKQYSVFLRNPVDRVFTHYL